MRWDRSRERVYGALPHHRALPARPEVRLEEVGQGARCQVGGCGMRVSGGSSRCFLCDARAAAEAAVARLRGGDRGG